MNEDPAARRRDSTLEPEGIQPRAASDAPGAPEPAAWAGFLAAVGRTLGTVSVLTAVAFFFGWVRTDSLYAYFGIDSSTLSLSLQDYLLRSVDALFVPLLVLPAVLLALLRIHATVSSWIDRKRHRAAIAAGSWLLLLAGLPMVAAGLGVAFDLLELDASGLAGPLVLGGGVLFLAYGLYLRDRRRPVTGQSQPSGWSLPANVLVVALLFMSIFLATNAYARFVGYYRAVQIAHQPSSRPGVVVRSEQRLDIEDARLGIQETAIPGADSRFHYEYRGLRLLTQSGGKYFLLPDGWKRGQGTVIVLSDSDHVDFEYVTDGP